MNVKEVLALAEPHKEVPVVRAVLGTVNFAQNHLASLPNLLIVHGQRIEHILNGDEGWGPSLDNSLLQLAGKAQAAEIMLFHACCELAIILKSLGVKSPHLDF